MTRGLLAAMERAAGATGVGRYRSCGVPRWLRRRSSRSAGRRLLVPPICPKEPTGSRSFVTSWLHRGRRDSLGRPAIELALTLFLGSRWCGLRRAGLRGRGRSLRRLGGRRRRRPGRAGVALGRTWCRSAAGALPWRWPMGPKPLAAASCALLDLREKFIRGWDGPPCACGGLVAAGWGWSGVFAIRPGSAAARRRPPTPKQ